MITIATVAETTEMMTRASRPEVALINCAMVQRFEPDHYITRSLDSKHWAPPSCSQRGCAEVWTP
eukprot:7281865-Pyramimonas_sp.AAC.1